MTDPTPPTPGQWPWGDDLNDDLAEVYEAARLMRTLAEAQQAVLDAVDALPEIDAKLAQVLGVVATTDGLVAQVVANPASAAAAAVAAAVQAGTKVVDGGRLGLDPTGVADAGPAILAAINGLPDGFTLKVPTGTYRIATSLVATITRSMVLDFSGSTLIHDAGNTNLASFSGTYDTPVTISALTPTTIPAGSGSTAWTSGEVPGLTFTVGSAVPWKRGDLVKVVSDSPLIGQRDQGTAQESTSAQARYGQHMEVYSVAGSTVTLVGELREAEQYTAGLRAARMRTRARLQLRDLTVTISDAHLADDTRNPTGISLTGLYRPVLDGVEVERLLGYVLQFRGCYRYEVRGCSVRLARDRITGTSTNFGYGILDSGSEYGLVDGYVASHVRHAFTDDSSRGLAGRGVETYGRTFGTIISNSTAHGTTAAAWDTHAHGDSVMFRDVAAYGCGIGFRLRGMRHSVRGAELRDCLGGIHILDEGSAWGWSHSHVISDVTMHNVLRPMLNYVHDGGPYNNVLEARPSAFDNITIYGAKDQLFSGRNSVTRFGLVRAEVVRMTAANGLGLFYGSRSRVTGDVPLRLDLTGLAATPTQPVFSSNQTEFHLRGYEVEMNDTHRPTALLVVGTSICRLNGGRMTHPLPSTLTDPSKFTTVSWIVNNQRAGVASVANADMAAITVDSKVDFDALPAVVAAFLDAEATTLLVSVVTTTAVTVSRMPKGHVSGQRLVVIAASGSTAPLTFTHGASAQMLLRGSASVSITINLEIEFVWNATSEVWVQTYAV